MHVKRHLSQATLNDTFHTCGQKRFKSELHSTVRMQTLKQTNVHVNFDIICYKFFSSLRLKLL